MHGNFRGTNFSLCSMITQFSQLYFHWPHILSFCGSYILSFCVYCQSLRALFSASPEWDLVCLAAYHYVLKTMCTQTCKCTNCMGNMSNSDAILPQSNRVGISWTPIFTFAKHNLTDRRVPDILIYVMTTLQLVFHWYTKNLTDPIPIPSRIFYRYWYRYQ